ncbi:thioesterase domain-containing protein, partial [Chromobacterium amazonense]|uniref:thioesterase domain-containing protein n=1 Tax=Chromobacterium amazonense TaxID=1382803 RepID=UPI003F7AB064
GHSLMAVKLLNQMHEQDMTVPLATLFAHPTLYDLALAVGNRPEQPTSPFEANPVPLSPAGCLPPLFLVHETSGDPLVYLPLAVLLPSELPVYALQALGVHTLANPPTSLEELATYHIEAIRRIQPQGPYHLAGWSIGGTIAYEMAQQLIKGGDAVAFLGMIDSYNHARLKIISNQPVNDPKSEIDRIIGLLQDDMRVTNKKTLDEFHRLGDVNQVINRCIEYQWLPTGVTAEDIFLRLDCREVISRLGQGYTPPASFLPIHLYAADERLTEDTWLGWYDIVGADSTLHRIGGTHHSIMQTPFLQQVADSIRADLALSL